jgi:hypothetical protein
MIYYRLIDTFGSTIGIFDTREEAKRFETEQRDRIWTETWIKPVFGIHRNWGLGWPRKGVSR